MLDLMWYITVSEMRNVVFIVFLLCSVLRTEFSANYQKCFLFLFTVHLLLFVICYFSFDQVLLTLYFKR